METFAPYGHAIVSMALVALIGLVLGPISALRTQNAKLPPGATPPADYGDATYRWHRAYANLAETTGIFVAATVAAMLAGAAPFWVNLFAALYVVVRVVHAVIHIRGIGNPNFGPRTMVFVVGDICVIGLVTLAIFAVF